MEEALEQTAQTTSRRSFLGVLKVPLASELTLKGKFTCDPCSTCGPKYIFNMYMYSGHIHVSFEFCQPF